MTSVAVRLSHKKFRALVKKHRRKLKRQLLAKDRDEQELKEKQELEKSPTYWLKEAEKQREEQLQLEYEERERERMHRLWLVREQQAQAEFQRRKELLEQDKKQEEEAELMQKDELQDAEEVKEDEVADKEAEEKKRKEDALKEAVASLPEGTEPWHNPLAPDSYNPGGKENCTFFLKTGCCRFGDRCSRCHLYPSISCTLLIKGMFSHFSIGQMDFLQDEYDADIGLEFDDRETYQDFLEFYDDVLPEFKKIGKVVQFKVCCNHEPHLRGNVYVQYSNEKEAEQAYAAFNGRWYAGKQISCEYTNVIKWKGAICGLFHRNRCPKGKNCNFLHVFKNPRNEFWAADNDIVDMRNGKRNGPYPRRNFRSCDHYRHRSRSPGKRKSSYKRKERRYSPEYVRHRHYQSSSQSHRTEKYRHYSSSSSEEDRRQSHSVEKSHSRAKRKHRFSSSSSSDEKFSSYSAKKSNKRKKKKYKKRSRKTSSSSISSD